MKDTHFLDFAMYCTLFFIFIGCSSEIKETGVKLEKIISADSLGLAQGLIVCDSTLIVLDSRPLTNNQIRLYSSMDYRFIKSIGRKGHGPGEFMDGSGLNKTYGGNAGFTIFDYSSKKLIIYKLKGSRNPNYFTSVSLKEGSPAWPVINNRKNIFSLNTEIFEGHFSKYDFEGNLTDVLGIIPPGKRPNDPLPAHLQACQGILRMTPDATKIIISYIFADLIDIYNTEGVLLHRISGPIGVTPSYKVKNRANYPTAIIDRKKAIYGYIDIAVTNTHIIALFSGGNFSSKYQGKFLHIYTLKGKLEKEIKLETKISRIAFDDINKKVFAITYYPEPSIYILNYNFDIYSK